ncbi:MAG: YihY/virulence factor BrkB family protein [Oscillospiraceae bacterium]|nr:YihY/virulence factor BrkB family protein [Oscillospiraceae bacterium]
MRTVFSFIKEMHRHYSQHNVPRAAGALAYFFVLSIFPLLLCTTALVGLAHVDVQAFLLSLERVLPRAALELLSDYVNYAALTHSPTLLYAAVPAIVLSASAALRVLLDTMDELYGHPRDTGLRRILISALFSALFLVTVYLSVLVIFTGNWFLHWLDGVLPGSLAAILHFSALSRLWRWLRYLLLFCFVMLLVLALYRLGTPKQYVHLPSMLVSSLLCSGSLVGASVLFSWFIGLSSRYSLLYGSLASIIILLLWLYLCGTILLLGAVFLHIRTQKHPKP